jgi:1,2-diacylglycerol 3-alpha-glucosyltransferase
MRIGYFTDSYRPNLNGVVVSMESFAAELLDLGSEVTVFAPRPQAHGLLAQPHAQSAATPPEIHSICWVPSVPLILERSQRMGLPIARWILHRATDAGGLDVVHTHTPFAIGYAGVQVARTLGIPIVHTYHTYYEEYVHYFRAGAPLARRITPAYSRWFCNLHDYILAPSHDIRSLLLDYGVRRPIEVFQTGVQLPGVADPIQVRVTRREFDLPAEVPVLMFAGRIAREKNLDQLLSVVNHLRAKYPSLLLVLAGDGPDRHRLERDAAALGIAPHVRFVGWVSHERMGRLFCAADVFVSASVTETQGLALLESMAARTPVVAARGPGVNDLIRDGESGILTSPTAEALAAAVHEVLSDRDLAARLAAGGRRRAEALSAKAQADQLLARYESLKRRARSSRTGLRGLAVRAREEVSAWR